MTKTTQLPKIPACEIKAGMTIRFNTSQTLPSLIGEDGRALPAYRGDDGKLHFHNVETNTDLTVASVEAVTSASGSMQRTTNRGYLVTLADGRVLKLSKQQKCHLAG
jgi:hypothetical protein